MTHIDQGALEFLVERLPIKTMIDVGCGLGGMAEVAEAVGVEWHGLDGVNTKPDHPRFYQWDFMAGPFTGGPGHYDLAWSIEFVEHVPESHMHNFIALFQQCDVVAITSSSVVAKKHPNPQKPEYWDRVLQEAGFIAMPKLALAMREASTMGREFMDRTGRLYMRGTINGEEG